MCGINGIVGKSRDKRPLLAIMNKAILHRGPDNSGVFISGSGLAGLGHNLLAIRGIPKATAQPITHKNVTVMLEGEIYNYEVLRKRYESEYKFLTESDAEVLIPLYLDLGIDFVKELEGEFSVAVWDESKRKLMLVIDPIGIKQVYYTTTNSLIVFSSEIRAILATGLIKKEFNEEVLFHALTTGYPFGADTAYKGILRLGAGELLVFEEGKARTERYFQLSGLVQVAEKDVRGISSVDLEKALRAAVKKRSVGRCKIGVSLSGGVDSSLVASYLLRERADAESIFLRLVSLGENEGEGDYNSSAVARLAITNKEISPDIPSRKEFMRAVLEISEDLVFNQVIFSEYLIFLNANKNGIKAILTGDGADELFLGYNFFSSLIEILKSKNPIKGFIENEEIYLTPEAMGGIFNTYLRENSFFFSNHFYFDETQKGYLLEEGYRRRFGKSTERLILEGLAKFDRVDELTRFSAGEIIFKLPQTLSIVNRFSSYFAVEARIPYLDPRIIRLALSLRQDQKVSSETTKMPLRRLAEKCLGEEIAYREKIGLDFPVNCLVKDKARLYKEILKSPLAKSGIFNMNYLMFRQQTDIDAEEMNHLDAYLLFLFLWHDYHFGKGELLELLD